jgi:hypothetical protein
MRLRDLVKVEGPADLGVQRARRDLLDQILERRPHEIFQFAGIGGQADRSGNRLHWAEIVERPFVADQSGREDRGADLAAAQRVIGSGRCEARHQDSKPVTTPDNLAQAR